ncbi:actin-associated protein FAM107A isoform X1 [Vidua chalybeata]|uniref:actin-associated protein FAM107A isoform X1 n=1 Tax=Vidua chalybeata TaxID=81927 RepID=UPI0023A7941D|nr:actin-associated protein FAM107A isoform X1 [Vidua chalybeata]
MCLINNTKGVFFKISKNPPPAHEGTCTLTLTWCQVARTAPAPLLCLAWGSHTKQGETSHANTSFFLPASMYTEIQRDRPDGGNILTHPDYIDGNPDLIKPKKLLNPVKASKSHQELHRELLMNHKRGLGMESKPELQRVLEHRRRDLLIKQKKEEEEAKKLQSPFEKELLKRHQRLDQLEKEQEKQEDHAPEFIKVKENLRRTSTVTGDEKAA